MTFIFRRQKTKLFAKKITNTNKNRKKAENTIIRWKITNTNKNREKRDEISLKNN